MALLFAGKGMAQTGFSNPKTEGEKQVETRLMDAFAGAEVNAIPYNATGALKKRTDLAGRMDCAARLQPLSTNPALKAAVSEKNHKAKVSANPVDDLTVDAELVVADWGTLRGAGTDDAKELVFSVEYSYSSVPNGMRYYLNGATFTFYNDSLKPIHTFDVKTSDTTQEIAIMGQYSSRFFNTDKKKEFAIRAHSFSGRLGSGPASCRDTIIIINEDGDVLKKIGSSSGLNLYSVKNGFSTENRVTVIEAYYSDLSDTMRCRVYKARDLVKEEPTPVHVFKIPDNLSAYCEGPLCTLETIDGEEYYVTTLYQKPFIANGDQSNPEVEMNNKFEITLYNAVDFTVAKKIQLPLIGIEDNNFSMSSMGYFGKYMISKHLFNTDDKYEIVYAMSRYESSCDCEKLHFYLMDEDGNILNEMISGVGYVQKLQDIPGKGDEFALLMGGGDAVEAIKMYSMPEMRENVNFNAIHENELLSVNFERVPNVNGDYEYVFGLGRGESADNTVYGGIAHYDRTGKMVKRVRVNLGPAAALFTPVISSMTMNPYFFIPDNKQEYLYFYKVSNSSGAISNGFGIANEDRILYSWIDNDEDGSFSGAGVLASSDEKRMKNLYIAFIKDGQYKCTFYALPLQKVGLQGEGTEQKPYIITTPAELDLVRNYPSAWFELGNDIDMAAFTGVLSKGFESISNFTGHFDGKNHYIKNLTLAGSGLFNDVTGGTIENLFVKNVVFTNEKLSMAGVIAGRFAMNSETNKNSKMKNCHVEADIVTASTQSKLGGLVGQAANSSLLEQCSFSGRIVAPDMEEVGGIVGDMRTGASCINSLVKGSVAAYKTVGGIAGSMLNGPSIVNSYSSADIYSTYQAAGIVGENSAGTVLRTYASGKIMVGENNERWDKGLAAGIAGETSPASMISVGIVKHSFALNDTVIATEKYARVANPEYMEDQPIYVKQGNVAMDSNYALSTMMLGTKPDSVFAVAASDTSASLNRMHGMSGTLDEFTQTFYEQKAGWSFGQDSAHPWKMTGKMPRLWYEFNVRGVELPYVALTLKKDSSFTMLAHVIPAEATEQGVNWKSSDPRVVSVNQSGVIKGVGAGTATVTAVTKEGKFEASCQVTVVIPVQSVSFEEKEITISPMKVVNISTTVYPEDATNKNVRYYSLNSSVLVVAGTQMMGAEVGDAKLLAVSEDGEASDTCLVHVRILAEDIYLNETNITLNKQKPTFQLEAEVSPEGASADDLVWESSNEAVCTVSDKGLVSGHKKGAADVTVSTPDGSVSAICIVTVEEDIDVANEAETRANVEVRFSKDNFVVTAASEIASVRVYDLSGQSLSYTAGIAAEQAWIPAAKYAAGIYFVKVELLNGGSAIVKVVKR